MNAKQKIHQAKMAKWAALIKDQTESGLTIRQPLKLILLDLTHLFLMNNHSFRIILLFLIWRF